MSSPEGHRHGQCASPCIDVLHDLVVGKPGGAGMQIVQFHHGVVAGRPGQDKIGEEAKLLPARQFRPGFDTGAGHDLPSPLMTATCRNRAGEAAWVIHPDWPGCPFPHVMNPYRRRNDRSATPSQLFQNSGVIP